MVKDDDFHHMKAVGLRFAEMIGSQIIDIEKESGREVELKVNTGYALRHIISIIHRARRNNDKKIAMAFCLTETPILRQEPFETTCSSIELLVIKALKEAGWDLPDIYFVNGVLKDKRQKSS